MASRSRTLTDHEEIRRWAEERGGKPACVRGTGEGEVGILRLDFPGYAGADALQPISWDEWFGKFDERGLALLVQDELARGGRSNFNKLVSRRTAASQSRGRGARRQRSGAQARGGQTRRRTPARGRSAGARRSSAGRSQRSRGGRRAAARSSNRSARVAASSTRGRRNTRSSRGRKRTAGTRGASRGAAATRNRASRGRSTTRRGRGGMMLVRREVPARGKRRRAA